MNEAQRVQLAYPNEPDWQALDDAVLIELVEQHAGEQSCATSAMTELARRGHPSLQVLCDAMLDSPMADQRLKAQALSLMLSRFPLPGFDRCFGLVGDCDAGLLAEMVEALNYEWQGPLKEVVLAHPLVLRVKHRLADPEAAGVEFAGLFFERFGA